MPATRVERWAFMPDEIRNLDACHSNDEFLGLLRGESVGIVVLRNGMVMNRYADGRVGVPEFVRRLIEREDVIYRQQQRIAGWRDVEVTDAGWPVRLCDEDELNSFFACG